MDQLAAAAAGATGEVALLEQAGVESAGDRVERGAGTHHATTDDEHVELALAAEPPHRGERVVAGLRD